MISIASPGITLFSQFVVLGNDLGNDLGNRMIVVATPFVVDGLRYTFITLLLPHARVGKRIRSRAVLIHRLSGVVLILLAIRLILII